MTTNQNLPTLADEKRARAHEFATFLNTLPPAESRHARMLHNAEETTCPILDAPDNYHFEGRCEDCDAKYQSRMTLGKIEDLYHTGRVTQDQYEAYRYVWALLSPTGSSPEWADTPEDPTVRRIARKLLRSRAFEVPINLIEAAEVVELAPAATVDGRDLSQVTR